MKENRNIWRYLIVIGSIATFIFIIIEVYNQTKNISLTTLIASIYLSFMLILSRIENVVNPITKEFSTKFDNLSKLIKENNIQIINGHSSFLKKADELVKNAENFVYVLRVHSTDIIPKDKEYFETTKTHLKSNKLNSYKRLELIKTTSSKQRIVNIINDIGKYEPVEIKIWNSTEFTSLFELVISEKSAILVFKTENSAPSYSILIDDQEIVNQLIGYYNGFWNDSRTISIIKNIRYTKQEITDLLNDNSFINIE